MKTCEDAGEQGESSRSSIFAKAREAGTQYSRGGGAGLACAGGRSESTMVQESVKDRSECSLLMASVLSAKSRAKFVS